MRSALLVLAILCLIANLVPSLLFLTDRMDLPTMKSAMLWATIAWYIVGGVLVYGGRAPDLESPVVP